MYPIKHILVCFDLSDMDTYLINYAILFSKVVPIEKISVMHVQAKSDIPAEITASYPDLVEKEKSKVSETIKDILEKTQFKEEELSYEIYLKEGNTTTEIANFIKDEKVDLCIVGRKVSLVGTGVIPKNLLRVAACNVLFIPENHPGNISRIMVPIDYSKQSGYALESAVMLASTGDIEILFQNVYTVPSGYHSTGKSYEEFAEIMKKHATNDFKEFIVNYDLEGINYECIYSLDDDKRPADKIYAAAKEHKVDLIVAGSKGKSSAATFLLGSVTEQLAHYDSDIPMFIVKGKETGIKFLDAILKL